MHLGAVTLGERFARQLARPTGWAGRLLGSAMDVANRRPTRLAIDLLDPQPGETVLDAGCGTGAAMVEVLGRARCRVVGIDRSPTMIRQAERRLRGSGRRGWSSEVHVGDIASLPFFPGAFDAVLALNVLYFCDAEARMVDELRSMLRAGGRLVAYVTHRKTMENWAFTRAGTHRLFDATGLAALFRQGGFAPSRIHIEERAVTSKIAGLFAFAEA